MYNNDDEGMSPDTERLVPRASESVCEEENETEEDREELQL